MIILPHREKLIDKNFFDTAFYENELDDFIPDYIIFQKLGPSEQYYLAQFYNWDNGIEVLQWIIDSPKCDKGTAGLIFWMAEPDSYVENTIETIPNYEIPVFKLLQSITERFNKNDFKSSRFKFEPGSSLQYIDFNKSYNGWNLPAELQYPKKGIVPISLGTIMNWIADYQRKKMMKAREAKRQKRKKK